MGLREAVQNAAQAGIAATGNIAETVNYDSMASTTYNVSAGTTSGEGFRYVTSMIFSTLSKEERSLASEQVELKAIVAQKDLQAIPTIHDEITRVVDYASTVYEMEDFKQDPAGATWSLLLRRK